MAGTTQTEWKPSLTVANLNWPCIVVCLGRVVVFFCQTFTDRRNSASSRHTKVAAADYLTHLLLVHVDLLDHFGVGARGRGLEVRDEVYLLQRQSGRSIDRSTEWAVEGLRGGKGRGRDGVELNYVRESRRPALRTRQDKGCTRAHAWRTAAAHSPPPRASPAAAPPGSTARRSTAWKGCGLVVGVLSRGKASV